MAGGSSWITLAFILANIILGVGLLNFPQAYHDAGGIATCIIIQGVSTIISLSAHIYIIKKGATKVEIYIINYKHQFSLLHCHQIF